jgi:hypothetical protein
MKFSNTKEVLNYQLSLLIEELGKYQHNGEVVLAICETIRLLADERYQFSVFLSGNDITAA